MHTCVYTNVNTRVHTCAITSVLIHTYECIYLKWVWAKKNFVVIGVYGTMGMRKIIIM